MNQIIERNYLSRLTHYKDNLLFVAINYNKEPKNKNILTLLENMTKENL